MDDRFTTRIGSNIYKVWEVLAFVVWKLENQKCLVIQSESRSSGLYPSLSLKAWEPRRSDVKGKIAQAHRAAFLFLQLLCSIQVPTNWMMPISIGEGNLLSIQILNFSGDSLRLAQKYYFTSCLSIPPTSLTCKVNHHRDKNSWIHYWMWFCSNILSLYN